MLKQYPLKNYNDIYQKYLAVLHSVEQKKASLLSLQVEYQQEVETLEKLEKLRANMHVVLNFLEQSKNCGAVPFSVPSIDLGSMYGHSLAISKYVLKHTEERVLIVTLNPSEYSIQSSSNCDVTRVHRNFDQAIRGRRYHRIILDNLKNEQIQTVLNSLPESLLNNVVIVGGSYGTTDD